MPRAASSWVSLRKVNGPERMRLRSQSALAFDRTRFLWPPILPGDRPPVSRRRFFHFVTQEGLICSASAIERTVSPRQLAPKRVRGYLLNRVASSMLASVPSMELESEIAPTGNPDSSQKQHALAVSS